MYKKRRVSGPSAITVIVLCLTGCADKVPPHVMLTNPRIGANLRDIVTVTADASDDEKLKKVELYINGVLHETSSGDQSIHSFTWNTDAGDNGSYSLYAKAYDDAGNTTISDMVDVTVTNYRTWTFINQAPTSMYYEFGEHSGYIYPWQHSEGKDTVKVEMAKNSGKTVFEARTFGHSSCGYGIRWYSEKDVDDKDHTWYFYIGDKYFLVYFWNAMDYDITRIVVNQDTGSGMTCYSNISRNSNSWSLMGYYDAITNPNLYAYITGHEEYSYVYWTDFTYNSFTEDGHNLFQAFRPELASRSFTGAGILGESTDNKIDSSRVVVHGGIMSQEPLDTTNAHQGPIDWR